MPRVPGSAGSLVARSLASVAQLVELLICNQVVAGSSPTAGSIGSAPIQRSGVTHGCGVRRPEGRCREFHYNAIHWMTRERRALTVEPAERAAQPSGRGRSPTTEPRLGQPRAGTGDSSGGSMHGRSAVTPGWHARRVGFVGRFPSGQRGQTVNLMAQPSQVRILLSPPSLNLGASEAGDAGPRRTPDGLTARGVSSIAGSTPRDLEPRSRAAHLHPPQLRLGTALPAP